MKLLGKKLRILILLLKKFFLRYLLPTSPETRKGIIEKNAMQIHQIIIKDLRRPNFSEHEFFVSDTAKRLGMDNYTDDLSILTNLVILADKMQEIRDLLNMPIIISSAYRSPDLNKIVGGKPNSQHMEGMACDFTCPRFGTPENIVRFLKEVGVEVDQCIVENNSWVHISIKLENNRNEFLVFNKGKYSYV